MPKLSTKKTTGDKLRSVQAGDPRFFIPETFSGPLKDMFAYVRKYPASMETALQRALRLIVRRGVDHVATENARRLYGDQDLICWNAFDDYYGIEPVLARLVNNLQAAACNAEQAFQVLFMQGGPSTAKSAIANRLKRLLVESEPVLCIKNSIVRAHPLCGPAMIPVLADLMAKSGTAAEVADIRMQFLKALNLADGILQFGHDSKAIFAKAGLDASVESLAKLASGHDFTTVLVDALGLPRAVRPVVGSPDMAVYEPLMRAARNGDDVVSQLANLEISNFRYQDSDTGAVGIAVVKETEPFKFDLSEVYGEEDLKAMMLENANPEQMVKLIGAYPIANRGLMEWVEMAKAAIQAIRSVLEATQDRRSRYPAPFGTRTLLQDMLIVAHTNTPEYVKLITTPGNEPFEDRFCRLDVLQPVRPDAIRKTIEKQIRRTDFALSGATQVQVEPTAVEICADFLAASRLELPKDMKLPLLKVVDIIGGAHYEPKETGTRNNVVEIMEDLGDLQGRKGKTLRWLDKIFGEIAGRALLNGRNYLSSRELIEWMDRVLTNERKFRGEDPSQDKTTKPTTELGLLHVFLRDDLKRRRARRLARMVRVALQIYLKSQGQGPEVTIDLRKAYSSRYLSVAQSLQEDASSVTADDKSFVNSIEAEMGVASSSRETMRNMALGMRSAFTRRAREAGQIGPEEQADLPLEAFEPLKKAIDRKIAKDIPPSTAIAMLRSDAHQRQAGLDTMSRLFGLTPEMAEDIAREVEEKNYLNELGSDGDD